MALVQLPYGTGSIPLEIRDDGRTKVYLPNDPQVLADPLAEARRILETPTGTPSLADMLKAKRPEKVVVLVNDETRPTPYHVFFPALLEVFAESGIRDECVTFLVATGLHKPHSRDLDRKTFGADMVERFRFVSHDARKTDELVNLGKLPSGNPLEINRLAVEADFLISLGVVAPHYFAGFSGSRKSVLPGVAGHETVEKNHARMLEVIDDLPEIHENPISQEMIWAARKVGLDFIFNAVVTDAVEPVYLCAGDLEEAWYKACEVSGKMFAVPFEKKADLCIISGSGYPRDVNMYQSQKALDHAERITKDGGRIVMLSESPEGWGNPVFQGWMERGLTPLEIQDAVKKNFVMGGHKAYGFARVAAHRKLTFVSSMCAGDLAKLFAEKGEDVQQIYDDFLRDNPEGMVAVIPQGAVTLPVPAI
jgi:nickel-dependent lactate racemase